MQRKKLLIFVSPLIIILVLLLVRSATAQQDISAEEIVSRANQALYYAGVDMKAKVLMKLISESGKERIREFTMLRLDESDGGDQKYFMYFHRPSDVREMTFMVLKHIGKNDDRWIYIPSIKLVRRIAANDKHSSFVGSDFSYEDISGREVSEDTHILKGGEMLEGDSVYVVESTPEEEKDAYYSRKVSFIDKDNFLPLKEEYYDKRGDIYKIFTADQIQSVKGTPTIVQRTMKNVQNGHRTEVTFLDVSYDVGLKDKIFSERYLRNAPRKWLK